MILESKPREWTDEQILLALALRDRGLSLRRIGERIGKTKNAVSARLRTLDREYRESCGAAEPWRPVGDVAAQVVSGIKVKETAE